MEKRGGFCNGAAAGLFPGYLSGVVQHTDGMPVTVSTFALSKIAFNKLFYLFDSTCHVAVSLFERLTSVKCYKTHMSEARQNPNLKIIFGVTLSAVMGVASITPAFPAMIDIFNLKPQDVGILITAFTLPAIFLTPLMGILADRIGRKRILVPSLLLFGIAGATITFARDFQTVVFLRVIQGIGATALSTLNMTLIGDLFEPRHRPEAMGYNASVLSLGVAVYPAIGGVLAGMAWYAPFYLPLFSIVVAFFVLF